jgi:hypothetical protein
MKRGWYALATWLMWLALPLTALRYLGVWDRLPIRMAVHFDVNWQPNGWTSREGALLLGLGIMAFMVVVFTVASYAVRANKPRAAWPVLVVFYLMLTFLWWVNHWIVQRNLNGQSSPSALLRAEFPHGRQSGKLTVLQLHWKQEALCSVASRR